MAGRKPEVRWQAVSGPFPETGAPGGPPDAETTLWLGCPRTGWEYAGTLVLKAASKATNIWLEVLGQPLGAMARSIGSFVGCEVACLAGPENAPGPRRPTPALWRCVPAPSRSNSTRSAAQPLPGRARTSHRGGGEPRRAQPANSQPQGSFTETSMNQFTLPFCRPRGVWSGWECR